MSVPRNTFRIKESLQVPFDIRIIYKTQWKDIRQSEIGTVLPSYWIHNLYINRKWERFSVMAGVENFMDKDYQEEFGFPGEGLNFIINVEVEVF